MSKHSVFALLLLLIAAVSASLFWGHRAEGATLDRGFDESAAFADAAGGDADAPDLQADELRPDEDDPREADDASFSDPQRTASAGAGPKVRVVMGADKRGVPGATVATMSNADYSKAMAANKGGDTRIGVVTELHGVRTRTDATGVAALAAFATSKVTSYDSKTQRHLIMRGRSSQWLSISAWIDGFFGTKWVRARDLKDSSVIELQLVEDKTLEILVVGPDQLPIPDFPLRLWHVRKGKNASRGAAMKSGRDGVAIYRHFQTSMGSLEQRWAIVPDVSFREPPFLTLSAAELLPRYTLRVPATGALEFELTARDGRVVHEPATVQISLTNAWPKIEGSRIPAYSPSVSTKGGLAVFEPIGLGVRVRTNVRVGRLFRDKSTTEYASPLRRGERVRHALRLGKDGISIRGAVEVVGLAAASDAASSAAPLAGTKLSASISHDVTIRSPEIATLDAEHRFSFFVPYYRPGVHRVAMSMNIAGQRFEAIKTFSVTGAGMRLELGTVKFDAPVPIVRGVVKGLDGQPIKRASIQLYEVGRDTKGKERSIRTAVPIARSDEAGRFALLGDAMNGAFRITVKASGYGSVTRHVELGAEDVEVRLTKLGILSLDAQFTPGIVRRVRFRARSSKSSRSTRSNLKTSGKMQFRLSSITPGTYDLTLEIDDWPEPIWQRRGFVVRSGSQSVGPVVDLRNALHRFAFRLAMSRGELGKKPRGTLNVRVRRSSGVETSKNYTIKHSLTIVAPVASVAYRAHLQGCEVLEGRATPGVTELSFTRQDEVTFEVPGVAAALAALPAAWANLSFRLVEPTSMPSSKDRDRSRFESGVKNRTITMKADRGKTRFEYPSREYEVTLNLQARGKMQDGVAMKFGRNFRVQSNDFNIHPGWLNGFLQTHTASINLGRIKPASVAPGKAHRWSVSATVLRARVAELQAKIGKK